jgi:hypothetical protein
MRRRSLAAYRLDPSETYQQKRAALEPRRRREVQGAEQEIADDPDHNHWRRATTRGTVLDFYAANEGLLIEFARSTDRRVRLIDLIDLANPS